MLIRNASVLLGKELKYVSNVKIKIQNNKFQKIQKNIKSNQKEELLDCDGLLIIPGFVNCHTHLGDSIGKDISINGSVDKRIHPAFGIKSKILKNSQKNHLSSFIKNSCTSMTRKGITTFVDFREGGLDGITLMKKAIQDQPIRSVILGRIDYYQNSQNIKKNIPLPINEKKIFKNLIEQSDGIGISGANENSDSVLNFYSKSKKIRAIHSAETQLSTSNSQRITGRSETFRALKLNPHFLVHMTHAPWKDLLLTAKKTRGIVVCPRANASLAEGIPDIGLMKRAGCTIALGTDNIMINSPDMFREMDYLWKVSMGLSKQRMEAKEILKMATVNAGKILRMDIGSIEPGKLADCIFIDKHHIDLEPMHDPCVSIVHRASETSIRAVMIGGKIVHGKI